MKYIAFLNSPGRRLGFVFFVISLINTLVSGFVWCLFEEPFVYRDVQTTYVSQPRPVDSYEIRWRRGQNGWEGLDFKCQQERYDFYKNCSDNFSDAFCLKYKETESDCIASEIRDSVRLDVSWQESISSFVGESFDWRGYRLSRYGVFGMVSTIFFFLGFCFILNFHSKIWSALSKLIAWVKRG
jgi:hypothetical protein